jgi:hypothetical protein
VQFSLPVLEVGEGGIPLGNCTRIVPERSRKDRINRKAQEQTEAKKAIKIQIIIKRLRPEANLRFLL